MSEMAQVFFRLKDGYCCNGSVLNANIRFATAANIFYIRAE